MKSNVHLITPGLHTLMIAFTLIVIIATQLYGFAAMKNNRIEQASTVLGYGMLVIYLGYVTYFLIPRNFSWAISLPLHVCDLLVPISSIALLKSNRDARSIQYFCSFILAGQAIATPAGDQNPLSIRFWLYWVIHAGIYSSASFDLIQRRYRPFTSDLLRVILLSLGYVSIILPLNVMFNWNYGFLGNSKPNAPTLIDLLGPWPNRVWLIVALAFLSQSLMIAPWSLYRFYTKRYNQQH